MWLPDASTQFVNPPVLNVASNKSMGVSKTPPHILGVCEVVSTPMASLYPLLDAGLYATRYMNNSMGFSVDSNKLDTSLRVITQPKHGQLIQRFPEALDSHRFEYTYVPDPAEDFVGNDELALEFSTGRITIIVHYVMSVDVGQPTSTINEKGERVRDPSRCPIESWKISLINPTDNFDFAAWQRNAQFAGLLANASNAVTGFSNLTGTQVGKSKGKGQSAKITLGTDAAGNGCFIDTTPDENREFLPTDEPTIGKAKPGSELKARWICCPYCCTNMVMP